MTVRVTAVFDHVFGSLRASAVIMQRELFCTLPQETAADLVSRLLVTGFLSFFSDKNEFSSLPRMIFVMSRFTPLNNFLTCFVRSACVFSSPPAQPISGGDVFGTVYENELITDHQIMCPPNIYGNVVKVSISPLTDA